MFDILKACFLLLLFYKSIRDISDAPITGIAGNIYQGFSIYCLSFSECSCEFPSKLKASRKLLRIKVTPDLHLTYSKNWVDLGLVLKMKNIDCLSILLTKHV